MAKAKKAAPNTKEKDTQEFFDALALMGQEKGIPMEYLVEKIKTAIALAVKKDPAGSEESIVEIDPESRKFYVAMRKEVVEEVEDPATQITIEDAVKHDKKARLGEIVEIPLEPKKFGRIAAQSAKHVIRQGIREAEKGLLFQEFRSRQHDIVTATVLRSDPKRGIVTLEIGNAEAILPKSEQVPGEELMDGQKIRVYVVDAQNGEKGPRLMISRTHPSLVKRLFEMQVPEIYDGVVEIKAISREAGSRSKLAVSSRDENVDPVGACIGPKGARVSSIVDELGGEKIDVVPYSEDPAEFIAAALAPAEVVDVWMADEGKACRCVVPDDQLSLAIGKEGQNARLAARLTGYKIDIKPESYQEPEEEAPEAAEEAPASVESVETVESAEE